MGQGSPDEAVVAMKLGADEDVATHLRIKLLERDRMSKAKGGTSELGDGTQTVTIASRPETKSILGRLAGNVQATKTPEEVDEEAVQERVK